MTARTLRVVEGAPAVRPTVTDYPDVALTVLPEAVWTRLEAWCAHRWGVRSVVFLVEGCGLWEPPLRPWTMTAAERWTAGAWAPFTPEPHPLGLVLPPGEDPVRITADVGEATAPEAVQEAFRRLACWFADAKRELASETAFAGAESESDGDWSYRRSPTWLARAIHLSGAADLLRPWRHLGAG